LYSNRHGAIPVIDISRNAKVGEIYTARAEEDVARFEIEMSDVGFMAVGYRSRDTANQLLEVV